MMGSISPLRALFGQVDRELLEGLLLAQLGRRDRAAGFARRGSGA